MNIWMIVIAMMGISLGYYVAASLRPDNDSTDAMAFAERYCELGHDSKQILDDALLQTLDVRVEITCT